MCHVEDDEWIHKVNWQSNDVNENFGDIFFHIPIHTLLVLKINKYPSQLSSSCQIFNYHFFHYTITWWEKVYCENSKASCTNNDYVLLKRTSFCWVKGAMEFQNVENKQLISKAKIPKCKKWASGWVLLNPIFMAKQMSLRMCVVFSRSKCWTCNGEIFNYCI